MVSMNDQQLDDLKQYIAATISQTEKRLHGEITALRREMVDGFSGVGEAIENIYEQLDRRNTEVDKRLTKLERQTV